MAEDTGTYNEVQCDDSGWYWYDLMNKTYDADEFLINASVLDLVHIFWKFKVEIEHSKKCKQQIKKGGGKISITGEQLLQIAMELKRIAKEDDENIRLAKVRHRDHKA